MSLLGPPDVAKLEAKRDVQGLIKALAYQKDAPVREAAARALGRIDDPLAVEPLIAPLKDQNEHMGVRDAAAQALGQIGDARAVEPLTAACKNRSITLSRVAAQALGQIDDPRAVEPLIAALKESGFGDEAAAQALGRIGAPAVEPLIAALEDGDWYVRRNAVEALGQIGDPRAVEPLVPALKDENVAVRVAAAEALGQIGDPRAVEPLIAALSHQDKDARRVAAQALGKIGDPRAVEPLIAAFDDGDYDAREAAADALGQIGDLRAVEPLKAAAHYQYQDDMVRYAALEALACVASVLKETAQTPVDEAELDYGAIDADGTLHGAPGLGLDVRLIALLHAKVCLATLVPELALGANVVVFGNQPMEGLFPRPLASALVQVARQDDCLVCRPLRGEPAASLEWVNTERR